MALIIMGIDPGLRRTGWGILRQEGSRLTGLACGVILTRDTDSDAVRLGQIARELEALIIAHKPDEAAVEQIFTNKNPASTQKLGLARGVALAMPARAGLTVGEYAATLIKKCVSGYGHADKAQMVGMIRILLPGMEIPLKSVGADAADALAVALTHAQLRKQHLLHAAARVQ